MKVNMEFQKTGVVDMLDRQDATPYYQSEGVDEVLRTFPMNCTRRIAVLLYTLGYIEGKRAERARRKRGTV